MPERLACIVCGNALPELAVQEQDPYCSRRCLEKDLGLGEWAEPAYTAQGMIENEIKSKDLQRTRHAR